MKDREQEVHRPLSSNQLNRRLFIILALMVLGYCLILARSFQLQFFPDQRISGLSERQYQRMIKLKPKRGAIYDRSGNELALSLDVPSLYARPRYVRSPFRAADKIARVTGISREEILGRLKRKSPFVWISRHIPLERSEAVSNLKIQGIGFVNEGRRVYPDGSLASHILGMVGVDGQGLEGVEKYYDANLRGEERKVLSDFDALGRPISAAPLLRSAYTSAHFLYLTISKSIQYFIERELARAVEESGADSGMAVVMVPQSGEIVALANYPTFDPNFFKKSPIEARRNRIVTDMYEPGSTMKILLAAIALQEGTVSRRSVFYCENGAFRIGGRVIREAQGHHWKNLTLEDIIKFSSNIGAAKVALQLGKNRVYEGYKKFGLGALTGIDLPGEVSGLTQPLDKWTPLTLSNVAFGQGISVTAIQLVTALSAIANGGKLMRPFVVRQEVDYRGFPVRETKPQIVARVLSPAVAAHLREMMVRVTDRDGTGNRAAIPGMRVAGKTGTAQKPDPLTGGYHPHQFVASFFGFAPADDPRLAVLVVLDNAQSSQYGGMVAAPLFRNIVTHALNAKGIRVAKEESAPKAESLKLPKITQMPVIRKMGSQFVIPSLRGLTMREVVHLFDEVPIRVKFKGSGIVADQSPAPNSLLSAGSTCLVIFSSATPVED